MPRRPRLAVVGSINVDHVVRVRRLPEPGETVTDATLDFVPGGKGANQAVAAARLGAQVELHACVGSDRLSGQRALGIVKGAGVDVSNVFHAGSDTGIAFILVDDAGENQIVVVPGANRHFSADSLELDPGGAVLCQLEIPVETVERAAQLADRFFLNAAPAVEIPASLVERAELVVVNRHELDDLPATPRLTALTLGAEGAVLLEGGQEVARAAPPPVEAVDGTAAGDAFTACLVVSLLEGRGGDEALQRACAAGALAASRPGAQPSLPTAAEVDGIVAA